MKAEQIHFHGNFCRLSSIPYAYSRSVHIASNIGKLTRIRAVERHLLDYNTQTLVSIGKPRLYSSNSILSHHNRTLTELDNSRHDWKTICEIRDCTIYTFIHSELVRNKLISLFIYLSFLSFLIVLL